MIDIADAVPDRRPTHLVILAERVFAVLMAAVIICTRMPDAIINPQFWAEDGNVIFRDQHALGLQAILSPYAGYIHFIPRLVAASAAPFGSPVAPAIYTTTAIVLTIWSVITIASCRAKYAWALAAIFLAVPHSGEVFARLINIQWIIAPALAFILATPDPVRPATRVNQLGFVMAASVTGPFSILALPIAFWRIMRIRNPFDISIVLACIGGASIQLATILLHYQFQPASAADPARVFELVVDRTFMTHDIPNGWVHMLVLAALVGATSYIAIKNSEGWQAPMALFAVLVLLSAWLKFRNSDPNLLSITENGDRYFFIPHVVVTWLIINEVLRRSPVFARMPLVAVAVVFLSCIKPWQQPQLPIFPWRDEAYKLDRGEPVHIPINPTGWYVDLP